MGRRLKTRLLAVIFVSFCNLNTKRFAGNYKPKHRSYEAVALKRSNERMVNFTSTWV